MKKPKILAVDDDQSILNFLAEILNEDFHLKTVSSGEKALRVVGHFKPDIILLDIMMPGIDGYEVCKIIRNNDNQAYTKILFLSAKVTLKERLEGYKVGGDDYITKPFEMEELLAKIKVFTKLKHTKDNDDRANITFNEKQLVIFYKIQRSLNDIIFIKSESPYCLIFSNTPPKETDRVRITINALDTFFKGKSLIRSHRSYMFNPLRIVSVRWQKNNECKLLLKGNEERVIAVPVGRSYHETLKNKIPSYFTG